MYKNADEADTNQCFCQALIVFLIAKYRVVRV